MEENENKAQQAQEDSDNNNLFGLMILQFMFLGASGENKGIALLLDVLKSVDETKMQELAVFLGVDMKELKRGVENIRRVLKENAEKNGMSVEELMDVVM